MSDDPTLDLEDQADQDEQDKLARLGKLQQPDQPLIAGPTPTPPTNGLDLPKPSPELGARRARDEAELGRVQSSGSGISQLPRAARIPLKILDTIGSVISPASASLIPGTELHHRAVLGGLRGNIDEDIQQQGREAQTAQAGAATAKDLADAQAKLNPPDKTKEEKWGEFAGYTDNDNTPLIREENSGQVVRASDKKPPSGFKAAKPATEPTFKTDHVVRIINGVPHEVLIDAQTGADVKDLGQTKIPGESPDDKRNAAEAAQVERESRGAIRKAGEQYRDTQKSVGQLTASIDAASDGNGLLTSFVPTMEVLGINAANGVHRISPAEAQAAGLPGGWSERFNAWFTKATTGKITPELKAEGKQLANVLLDTSYQRYHSVYEDEAGTVEGYGVKDFRKRVPQIQGGGGVQGAGGGSQSQGTVSFKVGSDTYNIPAEKVAGFKKKYPTAVQQ